MQGESAMPNADGEYDRSPSIIDGTSLSDLLSIITWGLKDLLINDRMHGKHVSDFSLDFIKLVCTMRTSS